MNEMPQATELKAALLHFENLLGELPEPDEVPYWMEQARTAFHRLESSVQDRRRLIHDKLFGEIAELDPSRLDQIQQLKAVDQDIEKLLDVVKTHTIVLGLAKSESEENDLAARVLDFVDQATELIYWIRHQEETVAGWFAEAFAATS